MIDRPIQVEAYRRTAGRTTTYHVFVTDEQTGLKALGIHPFSQHLAKEQALAKLRKRVAEELTPSSCSRTPKEDQ